MEQVRQIRPVASADDGGNKYPSTDLAYRIALASYDVTQKRWDRTDARIQTLLAVIVAIASPLPVIIRANIAGVRFGSVWFGVAMLAFVSAIILGIVGRFKRALHVIEPMALYENWLSLPEWEFKKNIIYFAGQHFREDQDAIDAKRKVTIYMVVLFLIGGIFLMAWALQSL